MLKDAKSLTSNSDDLLKYLVGEKIVAAFQQGRDKYLVLESGYSFVINCSGSFWVACPDRTAGAVARQKQLVEQRAAELGAL